MRKINDSFYKDACEYAKTELFRQKINNKSRPQFKSVKDFIRSISYYKRTYHEEFPYRKRIVIRDDDIRIIYDEFINEWNKSS